MLFNNLLFDKSEAAPAAAAAKMKKEEVESQP